MKEVHVIPASREFNGRQSTNSLGTKRRVAGYARVSTDSEDQYASYEAQVDYYTSMIKSHTEWEFAGMYTDEGISGTSTAKREGFKRMISHALSGKIDLIITKSVSRFARNTVDSLQTIRNLKEHKVEVYFEKEAIKTFDSKGELLITIMSSLAQEESRSISENVKWGRRKRFADGQVTVCYTRFLGYDKGPDGNLVINVEQAKIVRYIFSLFLQGMTFSSISKKLESEGYKTGTGNTTWHTSSVKNILTNEKYKGDALLQKNYTADFLTKKPVANKGEVPQYYVRGNHEAIIEPVVFDMVQQEIEYRSKHAETTRGSHIFSGRIRCGHCGGIFGAKVWHSNGPYRKVIWQCNHKYEHKKAICKAPNVSEDEIKAKFIQAVNKLISRKDEILSSFQKVLDEVLNGSEDEAKLEELKAERTEIITRMEQMTVANASAALDQHTCEIRYEQLSQQLAGINKHLAALKDLIRDKKHSKTKIEYFLEALQKQDDLITDFSAPLWHSLVDYAVIHSKKQVFFMFKNGTEIEA